MIQITTNKSTDSKQVRAGSRTYFFDVERTSEDKKYLRVTESRYKGEDKERERASIVVFPEQARAFGDTLAEMLAKLE